MDGNEFAVQSEMSDYERFLRECFDFRNGHIWGFDVPPVPVMCRQQFFNYGYSAFVQLD